MIDGAAVILIAFWKYKKKERKKIQKIKRNTKREIQKIWLERKTSNSKIQNRMNA